MINACGVKQVNLVGFSMGGREIARYLTRHGTARVSRVVLIASVVAYLLKTDNNPNGADATVFEDMKAQIKRGRLEFRFTLPLQKFGLRPSRASSRRRHHHLRTNRLVAR